MNYKEKQILSNIEKRLKTIMIGGLSKFEDSFGYLWNIDGEPRNDREKDMLDSWEDMRNNLLNHGNNQIRLAMDELIDFINYKNKFNHNYKFIFKDNDTNTTNEDRR